MRRRALLPFCTRIIQSSALSNSSACRTSANRFHSAIFFRSRPMISRAYRTSNFHQKITPFLLTDVGEGIAEVEITQWYIKEGDEIEEFDPICEVMSDKATLDISSRYSGTVTKIYPQVGEMAQQGKVLVDIDTEDGETDDSDPPSEKAKPDESQKTSPQQTSSKSTGKVLSTPAVRHIARTNNINLSDVPGTGKAGRILKEDIIAFMKPNAKQPSSPPPQTAHIPSPTVTQQDQEVEVKGMVRTMVQTMTAAALIPQLGLGDEINVDRLMEFRQRMPKESRVTLLPIVMKAVSHAITHYPIINSKFSSDMAKLIYKGVHNVGFAMDTPRGLIVPNVKDVANKSIYEISREIIRMHELGLSGKLGPEDLLGGTISISNIGALGGTYASPVVVPGEMVIGALGQVQKLPRYDDEGNLRPAQIMNVSWSADHRAIDGATIARFNNKVKSYLEDPLSWLMELK
eukprot:TRINITY_DN5184_c0_g1_i1.p1 TRINITY_DN5184_c0_g1~~TRINITY_DN5184_c0_g1_i1.p1  ORF type:complete len:460 (-),score=82.58 TRINITY_DN5184_c0_g1_i1:16-1395(-)